MEMKLNPLTGRLDMIGMTATEAGLYLKLDQSTPQTVDNGMPHFNKGLIIKSGEKLIFDGE